MPFPDISKPKYNTLDEVCNIWGKDLDTLLNYCDNKLLNIGIQLNISHEIFDTKAQEIKGFFHLSSNDVSEICYPTPSIDGDGYHSVKTIYQPTNNQEDETFTLGEALSLSLPIILTTSDLMITTAERDRFEKKYNITIGDTESVKSPDEPLSTKEKNTCHKIIAALITFQYGWDGNKPYPMAREIIEDADKLNLSLGETKLAEILKESAEFLPDTSKK